MNPQYVIRKAVLSDSKNIEELINISAYGLSLQHYSSEQVADALAGAFGLDTQLIKDETYFVAEAESSLVGCGGWSRRKTLFGGDKRDIRDPAELNPETEPAKIRAFFIHTDWARKGIAKAIYYKCESEAKNFGFRSLELMSTLPGLKFYTSVGFITGDEIEYQLPSGITITFIPMRKELG